jgi:hypothetical protein
MTLPKGDEKAYLEITPTEGGFTIHAEGQHAAELQPLFKQHGINCELHPQAVAGKDDIVFTREVDVAQVKEVLDAYKDVKGS